MIVKDVARRAGLALTTGWQPYTRLFVVGEGAGWSIDRDMEELAAVARRLDIEVPRRWRPAAARRQSLFYGNHFTYFARPPSSALGHRIGIAYFHGIPGTSGYPEFDEAFASLRRDHGHLDRVQTTHREMEELVLSSGIDPAKVFRIPIGVEPRYFGVRTVDARRVLGIPDGAFVVGSFQKDGVGWGDGLVPKLIKGPDVLVDTFARLRERVPELHVVLSGPARGYVTSRLDALGLPYVHRIVERYSDIGRLYAALDAYVVTSRQEGGPKGVLEAMAAGVPLVSTRVGQAPELVRDGENGWLADVEDTDALVERLAAIATGGQELVPVVAAGRATATANSYEAQLPLWQAFFDGFAGS